MELLKIPNCVAGEFKTSEETRILKDHYGNERVEIYNITDLDLRKAKRNIFEISEELKKIPLKKIVGLIKKSMEFYYTSKEEYELVASLTGSPLSFVRGSVEELKEWARNIDEYVATCFGKADYDLVPVTAKNTTIGYTRYIPSGPVVGILPKNSEVEAAYLMIQILLSKNPGIIKTSSSAAGPFSSIKYIQAIRKAIDNLQDPELEIIKKAFTIVGIFNTDRESLVRKLEIAGATYVIFGSNETIEEVEKFLGTSDYNGIVKMGTGLSVSAVLDDADISLAAKEVAESAAQNNGMDCISTNAIYVTNGVYDKFIAALAEEAEKWVSDSPIEENSKIGYIEGEIIEEISKRLKECNRDHHLKKSEKGLHLSLVELEHHHPIYEFPGPVLLIRKVSSDEELLKKMESDLQDNSMKRNLATAIFTRDKSRFIRLASEIPSYIIKHNKGTEKMNLLLEHQGNHLVKDFLRKVTLETE